MKIIKYSKIYHCCRKNINSFDFSIKKPQLLKEAYMGSFFYNFYLLKTTNNLSSECVVWKLINWDLFVKSAKEKHVIIRENMLLKEDKILSDYIMNHILCRENSNFSIRKKIKI